MHGNWTRAVEIRFQLDRAVLRHKSRLAVAFPRAGMPWSRAEERVLERGGSIRVLAKRVGRTEEAVRARLAELRRCARRR